MEKLEFNYDAFFKRLKKDPNKRESALKYELLFGNQNGLTVEDQPFYKDYLSLFLMPFQVAIPDKGDHDWGLLLSLIFGSFYSEYTLTLEEEWKQNPVVRPMVQLAISVNFEGQGVTRNLDELSDVHIIRLFEIYVDEQINSAIIRQQEDGGQESVDSERERIVSLYKKKLLQNSSLLNNLLKEGLKLLRRLRKK